MYESSQRLHWQPAAKLTLEVGIVDRVRELNRDAVFGKPRREHLAPARWRVAGAQARHCLSWTFHSPSSNALTHFVMYHPSIGTTARIPSWSSKY